VSVFELVTAGTITANDPGFPEQAPTTPDQFGPSTDPSRFTIWIPTEHVTVNMGNPVYQAQQANPQEPATENTEAPREVDAGFVAQTDNHIHFHTFGQVSTVTVPNIAPDPDPSVGEFFTGDWKDDGPVTKPLAAARAVLRLGKPLQVVTADGNYGSAKANAIQAPVEIGSAYPTPFQSWNGYAMITEGGSYQESWGNNVMVAGYGDLRLAGNRTVLVGSPGDVHIFADGNTIPDAVANDSDPTSIIGTGQWLDQGRGWFAIEMILTAVTGFFGLWVAAEATYHPEFGRSPQKAQSGWKPVPGLAGTLAFIGGFAGPTITLALMVKTLASPRDPNKSHGNVSLYAASNFTAYGKVTATLHSELSASVTSLVSASLTSVVTTSVSSSAITSVSGTMTTVGGLVSVGMSSQFGSARVHAKTTTEVSSYGNIFVTGNENVQVNSNRGATYVHGKTGFYIGCGAGTEMPIKIGGSQNDPDSGYGIIGHPDQGLKIGKLIQANIFSSPALNAQQSITIQDSQILIQHNQASITLTNSTIKVGGGGESRVLIG
jgi:hypothetical protein